MLLCKSKDLHALSLRLQFRDKVAEEIGNILLLSNIKRINLYEKRNCKATFNSLNALSLTWVIQYTMPICYHFHCGEWLGGLGGGGTWTVMMEGIQVNKTSNYKMHQCN